MDFAPFIMGFPIGMEGELSFLVPPGVTEIGVLAVGAAGGDNPVYNIADDFLISTVAGGSGDCVVVSPISVTPGEVLRLVLGSDGRVPQYENTSHQNWDNMLICTGIVAGGHGYASGGDGGNAGDWGGCGSSGGETAPRSYAARPRSSSAAVEAPGDSATPPNRAGSAGAPAGAAARRAARAEEAAAKGPPGVPVRGSPEGRRAASTWAAAGAAAGTGAQEAATAAPTAAEAEAPAPGHRTWRAT